MLLSKSILRLFICLCFLSFAAQTALSQQSDERKGYESYVEGIFKSYDADNNGSLDSDEVKMMRRQPGDDADSDSDGKITAPELLDYFLRRRGNPRRTGRRQDSDSRFRKKEKAKADDAAHGGPVTLMHDGDTITILGDADDVASIETLLKQAMLKVNQAKEKLASKRAVKLSVWVVRASESLDMDELKGKSMKFVQKKMDSLSTGSTCKVEAFHLDTIFDEKFELTRGSQVPVVQGVKNSSSGIEVNQISNFDVGTSLFGNATREGNNVLLNVAIESSLVEDSDVVLAKKRDDVVLAKTIQQFKLELEVECEPGKAAVVGASQNDHSWAFVFCTNATSLTAVEEATALLSSDSRRRESGANKRLRKSKD